MALVTKSQLAERRKAAEDTIEEIVVDPPAAPVKVEGEVTHPGNALRNRLGLPPKKLEGAPEGEQPPVADPKKPEDVAPRGKDGKFKRNKKVAPAPVAPAIDTEALATATAEGIVKGLAAAKPKEASFLDTLNEQEKRRYRVFEHISKNDPARKSMAEDYIKSLKSYRDYVAEWQAKNSGKKFDAGDDEHKDWFAENDFKFDPDEFVEVLSDLKAADQAEKQIKPLKEKLNLQEQEEQRRAKAASEYPQVAKHMRVSARMMLNQLGEKFKDVHTETGDINKETIRKLNEENPILFPKVFALADATEKFCGELKRIELGHVSMTDRNPLHMDILNFISSQEAKLLAYPPEDRVNKDGKQFVTGEQWQKLTPKQQESAWTFGMVDVSTLYAAERAEEAQMLIDEAEKLIEHAVKQRGYTMPSNGNPKPVNPPQRDTKPAATSETPVQRQAAPRSPAGTIAPKSAPTANGGEKPKNPVLARLFGRT